MADITIDAIDSRLAEVTAGLSSEHDVVRTTAQWRTEYWLDMRLVTAERQRAAAEVPC